MIDGITVLNTYEKIVATSWGWNTIATIFLCFGIIGFVVSFILCLNEEQPLGALGFISAIILICVCIFFNTHEHSTYDTVYQVTINDDINFNEITDKYNIIKQEGKIYHIMEKKMEE